MYYETNIQVKFTYNMSNKSKNSCINEFDPNALDEMAAIKKIIKTVNPIKKIEVVSIKNALNRTVSNAIKAPANVPSFRNSAMDGYAVNLKDLSLSNYKMTESGVSYAGKPYLQKLAKKQTIRVMTGALIPDNADAVIMKEMVSVKGNVVNFSSNIRENQNIRMVGEDIKKGDVILKKGNKIDFSGLSIISSLGIKSLKVFRKPRISFFSSGDELVSIEKKLKNGQIYDSNRYLLHGLLSKQNVNYKDLGVVKDKKNNIITKLKIAAKISDIIITTGGVSVGDADFIKEALKEVGSVNFWKIAIKPGRPLAFGKIKNSYFFGLPGNPVSAAITFQLFVIPAIHQLLSIKPKNKIVIKAKTKNKLSKKLGRTEYKRAILTYENGEYFVQTTGLQGSNIMMSMLKANSYIRLADNINTIQKNASVDVIPFETEI